LFFLGNQSFRPNTASTRARHRRFSSLYANMSIFRAPFFSNVLFFLTNFGADLLFDFPFGTATLFPHYFLSRTISSRVFNRMRPVFPKCARSGFHPENTLSTPVPLRNLTATTREISDGQDFAWPFSQIAVAFPLLIAVPIAFFYPSGMDPFHV